VRSFLFLLVFLASNPLYALKLPMTSENQKKHGPLIKLKQQALEGYWSTCATMAPQVIRQHPQIADWILTQWIRCVRGTILQKQNVTAFNAFSKELEKIHYKPNPITEPLVLNEVQLLINSVLDLKRSNSFEHTVEALEKIGRIRISSAQIRSKFYFELGKSYLEKFKFEEAKWFLERAYKLNTSNDETLKLLNATRTNLFENEKIKKSDKSYFRHQDEVKLSAEVAKLIGTSDLLAFAKEGVRYLKRFPMGADSEKVEVKLHQNVTDLSYPAKLTETQEKLITIMEHAPALYLERWFKRSHRKGDYALALVFAQKYLTLQESPESLWIAGRSAFFLGNYQLAEDYFLKLAEQYTKFSEIEDVFFKLAFSYIRLNKWSLSQSWLERLTMMNLNPSSDLIAKYWLIRVYEKMGVKSELILDLKNKLVKLYPFSYYGLIIAAEIKSEPFLKVTEIKKLETKSYPVTEMDLQILNRILLLANHGWYDEAMIEFRSFDIAPTEDFLEKLIETFQSFNFSPGMIALFNEFDLNTGIRMRPSWIKGIYDKPFLALVQSAAQKNKIDPILVWSLIRQESLFLPLIESPSQAIGLMQIIPRTAKEISDTLKKPILDWNLDGRIPSTNIQFGTWYLKDLIQQFDQSVPMALAAYNYGPTRLKTWKTARDLRVNSSESALAFDELWIDELPTTETQFYVKAILRNAIIYQTLQNPHFRPEIGFWRSLIQSESL